MQKDSVKKILHIIPHLGGGVGRVILNYLEKVKGNSDFLHKVICLEYANDKALLASRKIGFSLIDKMSSNHSGIIAEIAKTNIVLIHWWNHPLLYDFLVRTRLPPCRLVIWSHISGFHAPYVFTKKILQYPDIFVFTTPVCFETKEVQNLSDERKKFLRIVWSTGGVDHVKSIKPKKHSGFNIGYIGTVEYVKIHPNFLNICNKVNIPNVKFIVCGGSSEKEIKKEAEKMGIAEKFNFTGPISNINDYLSIFDIFGYPLAPYHYGTCDQSLQESMASGVVPVVLRNRMEKYMVKNGITGIVAKNENDYIKAIQTLYKDKILKNSLSKNARRYAVKNFSINKMAREWDEIFKETLAIPKTRKIWKIAKKNSRILAMDVFLESLGDYGEDFISYNNSYNNAKSDEGKRKNIERIKKLAKLPNWQAKTRGTVHHYNYFFSNDHYLSGLSKLMKKFEYKAKGIPDD